MKTHRLETMRRGACPSLSAPMQTGDGFLSRIALTEPVTPKAIVNICEAALRHGSGMIDISARGNLQARGLTVESAALFEADIRAQNLPLRNGIAIDTGPLAGIDKAETADPRPLANALRAEVERLDLSLRLAPKTAVIIDGGGHLPLSDLLADVRLKATSTGWLLFTGGVEQAEAAHALLTATEAVSAALVLLCAMAERGRRFRGRDFTDTEVESLLGSPPALPRIVCASPRKPFDIFPLKDGRIACGLGPAFGQIHAERLINLMVQVAAAGCTAVRSAPGHALLLIAPETATRPLYAIGAAMNLIHSNDDRRSSIAVCPGFPGCASAHVETHALAKTAVESLHDLLDGSLTLHISGCAKGCAHPEPATLTLTGEADRLHFIFDDKPSAPPTATLAIGRAPEALRTLSALTRSQRLAGETAVQCLRRIGPAALGTALLQESP